MIMDAVAIYRKLVNIKPFFENVERRKNKKAVETQRMTELVKVGGVYVEHKPVIKTPRILLYID